MSSIQKLSHTQLIAPGSTRFKRVIKDDFTEKEINIIFKKSNGNMEIALKMFDIELHTRHIISLLKFMSAWLFIMCMFVYLCLR